MRHDFDEILVIGIFVILALSILGFIIDFSYAVFTGQLDQSTSIVITKGDN